MNSTNSISEKLTISHPPIASMELPIGWFEDFEEVGVGRNFRRRRFHTLNCPTAEIFTYDSGVPVDAHSVNTFKELLSEKPKMVLPSTLEKIKNILGNMCNSNVFKTLMVYTQEISGRKVLIIEGRWSNEEDVFAAFMPEGLESRYIVELHYKALKEDFRKNLQAVKASLSTIKWQDK